MSMIDCALLQSSSPSGAQAHYRNRGEYYEKTADFPNPAKAVEFYSIGSDLGDRICLWNLGSIYIRGPGNVTRNIGKGLDFLEKAALRVDPKLSDEENEDRNDDPDSIIQWLQALIKLWDIFSGDDVSDVRQDFEKAMKYLEEAGESDGTIRRLVLAESPRMLKIISLAQDLLSHIYELGVLGAPQDYDRAKYWKKKAQRNGHSEAGSLASLRKIRKKIQQNSNERTTCTITDVENDELLAAEISDNDDNDY